MTYQSTSQQKQHFLIVEDDKGRWEISLTEPSYSLGRSPDCDIRLRSQFVSRHHATLVRFVKDDGQSYYRILDGDGKGRPSANGLRINGRKVQGCDLKHGDEVVFSPQVVAVYQYRQRDEFTTQPGNDPFDITLIDPAMMINDDDITEFQ
ncbi:FHA domain-containing protein [Gloeothece verrucosa]|uniref:FHA domain containing protein n=1 Tax=Gloeothece verrucosa (strain PCC 7822) TaxID=497965 RepID=E0U5U3_GLOV7|nr:FHA domain-containing protein [Gloeothece verrucosa]ADN15934.1 FHA domain containing protein [Gloeothece verrucosa PCC 7822]